MKKLLPLVLFLAGCGIKANPQVLKVPEVQIYRIGKKVYVRSLSGDIKVHGFEKAGEYWIKEEEKPFCFQVERIGEGRKRFCVGPALMEKPVVELVEEKDSIRVIPQGFESYRFYPSVGGNPVPPEIKTFSGQIKIERDYQKKCYAITGVRSGVESQPVEICVEPKAPPYIPEVEALELRKGAGKLYLVWFYQHDYREFVVCQDGKQIGRTTGFSFEVEEPKQKSTFTVKVINPLGFESGGKSVDYNP